MNLNHSDEKCLVLRRQVPRLTSEFISWEWVLRGWYHDDLTMRTFLSIFHTLCKQTFDSSSAHNMYVKRAQRGRGRNLQHFSSCGCWADPKILPDAQPSSTFTTPLHFVGGPGPLGGKNRPCHSLNILPSHWKDNLYPLPSNCLL